MQENICSVMVSLLEVRKCFRARRLEGVPRRKQIIRIHARIKEAGLLEYSERRELPEGSE